MTDWFVLWWVPPHLPLSAGVSVTMGLTGWMVRGGGSVLLATVFSASFRSVRVTPCQHSDNGSHQLRNNCSGLSEGSQLGTSNCPLQEFWF